MTRFSKLSSRVLRSVMAGFVITATGGAMLVLCLTLGALPRWPRQRGE